MGFINKLKNFFTGKGWKDDEELIQEAQFGKERQELYTKAEESQYKKEEKEKPVISKEKETRLPEYDSIRKIKIKGELKEAVDKYEKKPLMSTIEKGIKPDITNNVIIRPEMIGDLNNLKPQYDQLFLNNAKIDDKDILNILYENRGQLRHRMTMIIQVYIEGKEANTLEILGTLVEDSSIANNYITMGMQIDSPPQLDALLEEIGDSMISMGAMSFKLKGRNMHKGKVSNIETQITFA